MEAYGFVQDSDEPIRLAEVSLALSPNAMRSFAAFVTAAAAEMERLGPSYDHLHWQDQPGWDETWPDIQLTKVYSATSGS
jgi:hypothetical protein